MTAVELPDQCQAALVSLTDPADSELERLAAILLAKHALGEMDQLILSPPGLFLESQLPDERLPAAGDAQGEGSGAYRHGERLGCEGDGLAASLEIQRRHRRQRSTKRGTRLLPTR